MGRCADAAYVTACAVIQHAAARLLVYFLADPLIELLIYLLVALLVDPLVELPSDFLI